MMLNNNKSISTPKRNSQATFFIYLIAAISGLGGLLFGFDTGVISGAQLFIRQTFVVTTVTDEIIVSCVVLGALIGAISSGRFADHFGRRCMLINAALTFIVGTFITVVAPDVVTLIIGRFILGLAIGVASYTTPLFISEMAPASIRGSLVLLNAIAITAGEAVAYLIDYALTPTQSWRLMFAVGLIPAILLLIGMMKMPCTPRWMVLKGFNEKAKRILQEIRKTENVDTEFNEIKTSFFNKQGDWRQIFSKKIRPVLIIGLGLGIFQQFIGINTVLYYGPIIFQHAGFKGPAAQIIATFGMGLVNLLMSIVAFLIVDKVGRRRLLLIGSIVATLSLAIIGASFRKIDPTLFNRWVLLAAMVVYIAGYCLSVGSMFWLVISEIYPLNIRGFAMSFVTAVQWGANFLVAATFLTLINFFGITNVFWFYGLAGFTTFIFCYYLVPETTHVSLETIENNLELGIPSRKLGQPIFEHSPQTVTNEIKEEYS